MTDKQIAMVVVNNHFRWLLPCEGVIRSAAEQNLRDVRVKRIQGIIREMLDELRQPLVEELNKAGIDTT